MAARSGSALLLISFFSLSTSGCAKDRVCETRTASQVHSRAHAHNDYRNECPLQEAVSQGFTSVEVDVWHSAGEVMVGHELGEASGSLREMYLEPLQTLVNSRGSVHGDGSPFYLWVDLKEGGGEIRYALNQLLNEYSMLSVFSETSSVEGPVTVILTRDDQVQPPGQTRILFQPLNE